MAVMWDSGSREHRPLSPLQTQKATITLHQALGWANSINFIMLLDRPGQILGALGLYNEAIPSACYTSGSDLRNSVWQNGE